MQTRLGLAASLLALALTPTLACSPGANEAGINFYVTSAPRPQETVRFRFDQGSGWRDAASRPTQKQEPLYDYQLESQGNVRAEATLLRSGRPVARAAVTIDVGPDQFYLVYAAVQPQDPTNGCMGCIGVTSTAIAGEQGPNASRLWLYWSFNGISQPIMF